MWTSSMVMISGGSADVARHALPDDLRHRNHHGHSGFHRRPAPCRHRHRGRPRRAHRPRCGVSESPTTQVLALEQSTTITGSSPTTQASWPDGGAVTCPRSASNAMPFTKHRTPHRFSTARCTTAPCMTPRFTTPRFSKRPIGSPALTRTSGPTSPGDAGAGGRPLSPKFPLVEGD
jgi:hypothetical protein